MEQEKRLNRLIEYRKENGLCVTCGEPATATRLHCWGCYQNSIVRARVKGEKNARSMRELQMARS